MVRPLTQPGEVHPHQAPPCPRAEGQKLRTSTGALGAVLAAQRIGQIADPVSRMYDNQVLRLPGAMAG